MTLYVSFEPKVPQIRELGSEEKSPAGTTGVVGQMNTTILTTWNKDKF